MSRLTSARYDKALAGIGWTQGGKCFVGPAGRKARNGTVALATPAGGRAALGAAALHG